MSSSPRWASARGARRLLEVVAEPHLFTVLTTRARHRFVVVVAGEPPPGLVADYLDQARRPPRWPDPAQALGDWASTVACALRGAGLPIVESYPVGRHSIDICVGDGIQAFGVVCDLHPDGPAAHIDRHLALLDAGWDLTEAHRSRWQPRLAELTIDLTLRLHGQPVR